MKKQAGFTLLELIIALSLMAVISITATQMLRSSTTQTKKITEGIDDANRLRAAFNIIKNDFAKAINYRSLNRFLYIEAEKERAKRYDSRKKEWIDKYNKEKKPDPAITEANMTDTQRQEREQSIGKRPKPPPNKPETIYTHFLGEKEKVYFSTASGVRFRTADKISDLAEVGYFLKTCKGRKGKKQESDCLWRSVSYHLDEKVNEGGKESVLLENVTEFEFEYLSFEQKDDPDWMKSWDSSLTSDAKMGGQFPAAVSLQIEIKVKTKNKLSKKKPLRLKGVFELDFPNNRPFESLKPPTGAVKL